MNNNEYLTEIRSIADSMVEEVMSEQDNDRVASEEEIQDTRLHETIDGHQWVIYYSFNLDVIKYSDNADYMIDNFGSEYAGDIIRDKSLADLNTAIAFWAMYADVQDYLEAAFDEYEANIQATA